MTDATVSSARTKAASQGAKIAKALHDVATELAPKDHAQGLSTLPADLRKGADLFDRIAKAAEGEAPIDDGAFDATVRLFAEAEAKIAALGKIGDDLRRAGDLVTRIAFAQKAALQVDQILDLALRAASLLALPFVSGAPQGKAR